MAFLRILVVEDFEPFRRFIRAELEQRVEIKVVGEAVDGPEAIKKANELKPDLVLLDIGLPKLSGMEVARQIRDCVPQAKILFVSQEPSPEVVREALELGGAGYVHKPSARRDLLAAIDAALEGKRFVSGSVGYPEDAGAPPRHEAQFYSDDQVFLESAADFLAKALRSDNAAIVLATSDHRECLLEKLKRYACDVESAIVRGTYISQDAADALAESMVDGLPDRRLFFEGLSHLIERATSAATSKQPRIAICGECVGLLCAEGNTNAAIQIEQTGNDLLKTHNAEILCGYPISVFQGEDGDHAIRCICAEHTSVTFG